MKTIVLYYSGSGNNKYLALKIAQALNCESEAIRPRLGAMSLQVLFSLIKKSFGINNLKHDVVEYDSIILAGPIYMGQLASPLRDFLNKYKQNIKKLYFVTCCGGNETTKDDKFGYMGVFKQVQDLIGDACLIYKAFPVSLVLSEEELRDPNTTMKARLSDENFKGAFEQRVDVFIQNFKE